MKKSRLLFAIFPALLLLTSCGDEGSPYSNFVEELKSFSSRLIPNIWSFLIQLSALILLIVVAIFLVYKPVKKMMKTRADFVEGNIKESEENKRNAIIANQKADELVKESKKTAQEIIQKANDDAEIVKDKIIQEGKNEADKQIESAKKQIEQEVNKAKEEIHKEIVDVAISASEKLLEREINDEDNEKLVDSFVNDIRKGNN